MHQVRIKVKANKDDEPEDDAEPAIQATACGQASGEAVPTGAKMQPLAAPPGEGDIGGGYEGPQICTSQWGYDYLCLSRTPMLSLSLTGTSPTLSLPPTFINQQVQASFVVWNYGGGRLTGTVSVPAPFSIVSGASFSLLPGQPQEVVVRFSSGTAGSFSKSISISSNGGSKAVTATSVAHKVSFYPAQVDFGSGLFVVTRQYNNPATLALEDSGLLRITRRNLDNYVSQTDRMGLPIEKTLTVKNEGTVSVTLTLSTAAPYKIVSVLPTLSPGQSGQVTLRFDPAESGTFTGNVQVGIQDGQGSITSPPLVGLAHKIEIDPAELNFGIVFRGSTAERKLMVKNQGVTAVTLEIPNTNMTSPFNIVLDANLTLGPGESKEVPVRFGPTEPGTFQGDVSFLISGQSSLRVPAISVVYGFEEFLAALSWAYNMIYAENINNGNQLLLAGFNDLSLGQIQELMNFYGSQTTGAGVIDPEKLAQIQQADDLWRSLEPAQVNAWLQALAQALQENRFEEEYDRLLPQGLDKLVEATLLMVGVGDIATDSSEAKQAIRNLLTTILEQGGPLDVIRWMQQSVEDALCRAVSGILCTLLPAVGKLNPLWLIWKVAFYDPFKQAWDHFISLFVDPNTQQLTQEGKWASTAIMYIAVNMANNLPVVSLGYPIIDDGIRSFENFLAWAYRDISRLDQALGTLFSAAGAVLRGWVAHPFRVETNWAASVLLLPQGHNIPGVSSRIMVLLRGDHCTNCAANANNIVEWLQIALQRLQDTSSPPIGPPGLGLTYGGDMKVIVLSFTNTQATGVDAVKNKLKSSGADSNSVLIVMVYWDSNGQPQAECISTACVLMKMSNPTGFEELMRRLKEAFLWGPLANLNQHELAALMFGICGGDLECVLFFAEQLAKEPPQPKDPSEFCPPIPDDVNPCY